MTISLRLDDEFHERAVQFAKGTTAELISTLTVVTEVVYLLDFHLQAQLDFQS
jgi:hypothetical protein